MQEYLFILDFEISDEYINFPAEGVVGGEGGGYLKERSFYVFSYFLSCKKILSGF